MKHRIQAVMRPLNVQANHGPGEGMRQKSRDETNKTKPMRFEEFETEIAWWGDGADGFATRVQSEQAWKVPVSEIVARNYNLDIKNPHVGEQVSHDPDELLAQYQRLMDEVAETRAALKRELAAALERKP